MSDNLFNICNELKSGEEYVVNSIQFDDLFELKYPNNYFIDPEMRRVWFTLDIFATLNSDMVMKIWNGTHPYEDNITEHFCPKDTVIKVVMISRLGDLGITCDHNRDFGYDLRISIDDLTNWIFKKK